MSGQRAYGSTLTALRTLVRSAAGPGSRLPTERELSGRLGVNRATVRKALARLELEGVITREVGRGTFVGDAAAPDDAAPGASPIELIEARHVLEPVVVREAALRARRSDLDRLQLCLDRAEAAQDFATFEEWDAALHDALAEATHNPVFVQVMRMLRAMRSTPEWNALKRSAYSLELRDHYNREHREIFEIAGAALPGDSGSGVVTSGGLAAGDLTHLVVDLDRYPGSDVAGTRMTRILSYLGGNFFLVNADRTTSRATRSDTTCGPSNNGGPALPGLPVSLP